MKKKKDFDYVEKLAYLALAFNMLITLNVLLGIVFFVYKVLAYFGIL